MPGNDPSWNSLTCFAYPLHISHPADNRTGDLLMTRFEVDARGDVKQVLLQSYVEKHSKLAILENCMLKKNQTENVYCGMH